MSPYLHTHSHQPKIPGIVVLGVLLVFGLSIASLFQPRTRVKTQDVSQLVRIDVANVRDSSVTLFWRTKDISTGYVQYGMSPDTLDQVAYDERDANDNLSKRHNHVVTLHSLNGASQVYYRIAINDTIVGQTAELPYTVDTLRKLTQAKDINPLYGTLSQSDGTRVKDAVVIAHIAGARPLLAQANTDGTFLVSLCCVFEDKRGEPLAIDEQLPVRFEIIRENGSSLLVQSTLGNAHPMSQPIIVDAPVTPLVVQRADASSNMPERRENDSVSTDDAPEVLAVSDTAVAFQDIDVIFPQEGSVIPGSRPLIKGFGEPGMEVKGSFKPENRLFNVTVDENRYWMYEPSFDFQAGEHELVIQTQDSAGKTYTFTRAFTILKSGESVLGDATGSATLTPSPEPTTIPTATPSPTLVIPSTTPPVTGMNIVPLSLLSLLLIVIGAGIVLLF